MPSRRKQTVGSCQLARGHRRSAPCGGAGHLTEGSSSLSSLQTVPGSPRRRPPTINPPRCCSSLDAAAARSRRLPSSVHSTASPLGAVGTKRTEKEASGRVSTARCVCLASWLCGDLPCGCASCFLRSSLALCSIQVLFSSGPQSFQLVTCVSTWLATANQSKSIQ